jgi:glucose/mannose-6-phosphate isomerase
MTILTHETALDNFHEQVAYVLENYAAHGRNVAEFDHVIIGGLGGSGIGGKIARLAFYNSFPIPIEVISEYKLPAFAGKRTLVILNSYSGNTEETLSMYADGKSKGCPMMVLTSGGTLADLAKKDGLQVYYSKAGFQPRMALGYSLCTLLMILAELIGYDMRSQLEAVRNNLKNDKTMRLRAEEMLHYFMPQVHHKYVVICDLALEAVAIRFCQQVQENAKGEAFVSILPEANHNMIESYYSRHDTNFILLNSGVNDRNTLRFHYLKSVLEQHGNKIFEYPLDQFGFGSIFEIIHTTDWLSIFISNEKGVDNLVVENINGLKGFLEANA